MIEYPEAITIGREVANTIAGKKVTNVWGATHLHKFTFFNDTAERYRALLMNKRIVSSEGKGIFVDVRFEENLFLSIFDGINMRYGDAKSQIPDKYQLLIALDNDCFVSFTTTMYGGIYVFQETLENKYRTASLEKPSPLSEAFDQRYFEQLVATEKKPISVKGLLATEQRIPGVGNGVLQDILFNAGMHPKRKISTLTDLEKEGLFGSIKTTLAQMIAEGGRDTESDFFGQKGRYRTILSKNTSTNPCPRCGATLCKETYMGGSIYYCPCCQPIG